MSKLRITIERHPRWYGEPYNWEVTWDADKKSGNCINTCLLIALWKAWRRSAK